jgi:hypothetical protein
MWAAETVQGRFLSSQKWVDSALVKAGVPAGGQARVGCRSSLRRGRGRHDGVRGALAGGVNQRGDHARSADIRLGWRRTHQAEADPRSRPAARATTTSPNDGTPKGHSVVT